MANSFDDRFIEELHLKNNIEDIISEYTELRRRGRMLTGLCPFHNEKTPSFTVYPETQSFYCYGCGAGGEVITFIRRAQNLDFLEAVKYLADRAGMQLPNVKTDDGYSKLRQQIFAANRAAAKFYHETLYTPKGKEQLEYLRKRGLSDGIITRFGLGAAPNEWTALLDKLRKDFSPEVLVAANLVRKSDKGTKVSYYDAFRNKVVFPVIDVRGNVIAFGCRVLDNSKPKYVNSSDTPVYKKSNEVYALNLAKGGSDGSLILCEGYMDVIALHSAGFTNAIAGLGTALTPAQVSLISRYADSVNLCYDSDEAGQAATAKALSLFSKTGLKVKVIKLEGGKDPDDIIRQYGKERFRNLLDGANNDIEYKLSAAKQKYDTQTADGRAGYVRDAARLLAIYGDVVARDVYASKLSEELSVGREAIIEQIKNETRKLSKAEKANAVKEAQKQQAQLYDAVLPKRGRNYRTIKAQEIILATLIASPSFLIKLKDKLNPELFETELYRRFFELLQNRINNSEALDLAVFSSSFSPEEMGPLSKLYSSETVISNTVKECEDCIAAIKQEEENKTKKGINPSSLDDDEFLRMITQTKD